MVKVEVILGDCGMVKVNEEGEVVEIGKEWLSQGYVYKNSAAFYSREGICYIPELTDNAYTYYDFLEVAEGDSEKAEILFENVDWQSPESLFSEWDKYDFFGDE